jgi:hypothetical protein
MAGEFDSSEDSQFPTVDRIDFMLSPPRHGWIRVSVRLGEFELKCSASTVLNDPLAELLDAVCFVNEGRTGFRRVCLWLEPEGYALDLQCLNESLAMLTVLHDDAFVPPMAASPMKRLFRCRATRVGIVRGLHDSIARVLLETVVDGSEGDRKQFERFRQAYVELQARRPTSR